MGEAAAAEEVGLGKLMSSGVQQGSMSAIPVCPDSVASDICEKNK